MSTNSNTGQPPKRTVAIISIDQIDLTDTQFQVRTSLDQSKIKEYEQLLQDSGSRDLSPFNTRPLVWKRADGRYAILDGWHRCHAAKAVGITGFEVEVLDVDQTEAIIQAMKANLSHGLPLKPQERIEACFRTIEVLTKGDVQPSNQAVAARLGVCEGTIRNYRNELEGEGKLKPAVNIKGKDGKVQAAKKVPQKPAARLKAAMPIMEGLAGLQRISLFAKSGSPSTLPPLDSACQEVEKAICDPAPTADPGNTPGNPEDQGILKRATEILRGLDQEAWQACEDPEELDSIITELMDAGIATFEAKGAARSREKAA